jgi:hypothetical protein
MRFEPLESQGQKQNGRYMLNCLTENTILLLNLYCFLQLSDVVHRYHDGAEITSSEHVKLSESGESYKLELKDAQLSDSGIYKCKIVNRLGEKTHEAKLSLICKF